MSPAPARLAKQLRQASYRSLKRSHPRVVVDSPLPAPLARGVVVLQYRAENVRIVPVFGPAALAVSPRIGHLHVMVDDLPWDWADASGIPVIIQNLPPGPHRVLVELADANHHILDHRVVEFVVPDVGQQSPRHMRVTTDRTEPRYRMGSGPARARVPDLSITARGIMLTSGCGE
jgi:hypothetical protein